MNIHGVSNLGWVVLPDEVMVSSGAALSQRRPSGGALSTCDGRNLLCATIRVPMESGAERVRVGLHASPAIPAVGHVWCESRAVAGKRSDP